MNYNQVFNIDSRKQCTCIDGIKRIIFGSTEEGLIKLNVRGVGDDEIITAAENLEIINGELIQTAE